MSYSFSDLNTAQRCLKRYEYAKIRRLQRKARATTITQGSMIHRFLMHGYLQIQAGNDWWHELEALIMEMEDEGNDMLFADEFVEYTDLLGESGELVTGHFDLHPFDRWEILHVEEQFNVTIDDEKITFTPDLVARDEFGKVWIIDHKSTSSGPESGIPFATQQSLLYYAGVQSFYPETVGFLFNWIRKKIPTEPRLNKTKNKESGMYHVNDLNRIDTTFKVLNEFIRNEAPELLGHPAHMERLAELRDKDNTFYWTSRILVSNHALRQIVEETSWVVNDIIDAEQHMRFPRNLQEDRGWLSCGKCEFEPLCSAELLGLDTTNVLRDYEPREEKNPYEREAS